MIPVVRHVDSVFSIDTDVEGIIELMQTGTFPVATGHHGATGLSPGDSVSLHASRCQWRRELPRRPWPIPSKRCCRGSFLRFLCHFHATTGSLVDSLDRRWWDCRSLCRRAHLSGNSTDLVDFLLRYHQPALCHWCHPVSIPWCGDSPSQRRSPCPPHRHGDLEASGVGGWPPLRPCPPATVTPFCAHLAVAATRERCACVREARSPSSSSWCRERVVHPQNTRERMVFSRVPGALPRRSRRVLSFLSLQKEVHRRWSAVSLSKSGTTNLERREGHQRF